MGFGPSPTIASSRTSVLHGSGQTAGGPFTLSVVPDETDPAAWVDPFASADGLPSGLVSPRLTAS